MSFRLGFGTVEAPAPSVREVAKVTRRPDLATHAHADAPAAAFAGGGHMPMGGNRAHSVHDRRVMLSSKRTHNRKFTTHTISVAGTAIAVAAIASGAAADATTATGRAATCQPHRGSSQRPREVPGGTGAGQRPARRLHSQAGRHPIHHHGPAVR